MCTINSNAIFKYTSLYTISLLMFTTGDSDNNYNQFNKYAQGIIYPVFF